jgi:hypothetical protein
MFEFHVWYSVQLQVEILFPVSCTKSTEDPQGPKYCNPSVMYKIKLKTCVGLYLFPCTHLEYT